MPNRRRSQRDPERIEFSREQRQTANEFSRDVWELVRGRRLLGEKFRREHPVGPYTLDFVCLDLMLDLEIDGKEHLNDNGKLRDRRRDAYLKSLGFEVMRINGFRVTQDAVAVKKEIEAVMRKLRANCPSPPTPLPREAQGRGETVLFRVGVAEMELHAFGVYQAPEVQHRSPTPIPLRDRVAHPIPRS